MKNFTPILAGLALTAGCVFAGGQLFAPNATENAVQNNFAQAAGYIQIDETEPNIVFDCIQETLHDTDNEFEIVQIAPDVTEILLRTHCAG